MMINILSWRRFIEERHESRSSCKRCWKKSNIVKRSLLSNSRSQWKKSDKDEQHFKETNECHICNQAYTNKDIRVRDHCQITGSYRGSAHQDCNLKLQINPKEFKIPVIFHDLRGYDGHFIIKEVGSIAKQQQMDVNAILNNMKKYMAFMFLSSSLNRLIFAQMHSNTHPM